MGSGQAAMISTRAQSPHMDGKVGNSEPMPQLSLACAKKGGQVRRKGNKLRKDEERHQSVLVPHK